MTEPKTNRIPAPLYAAAGAGELAYHQLRKLPAVANELSGKAAGNGAELRGQVEKTAVEFREQAIATTAELREKAAAAAAKLRSGDVEVERLREIAMRNAAAFVASAQAASGAGDRRLHRARGPRRARRRLRRASRPPTRSTPTWRPPRLRPS